MTFTTLSTFISDNRFLVPGLAFGTLVASMYFLRSRRSSYKLAKLDWKPGTVYLIAPPIRPKTLPSFSPYAVKLETFLKASELKYECVKSAKRSPKGNFPFIEYNGKPYSDTNLIMRFLAKEFQSADLDGHLSKEHKAQSVAFCWMFEEVLIRCLIYLGMHDFKTFSKELDNPNAGIRYKLLLNLFIKRAIYRSNTTKLYYQGFGRFTLEELTGILHECFEAATVQLGEKEYLFGDKIARADIPLFTVLFYTYAFPSLGYFDEINERYPALAAYTRRNQQRFWPQYTL